MSDKGDDDDRVTKVIQEKNLELHSIDYFKSQLLQFTQKKALVWIQVAIFQTILSTTKAT